MITNSFNIERSFWEEFPQLKHFGPCKDLHNKDKSKKKDNSSMLMWAIHLLCDRNSKLYNLPDKEEVVKRDWLKDETFDLDKYSEVRAFYEETCMTQAERSLLKWNESMRSRDKFLSTQKYSLNNAAELDKMNLSTGKM